LSVDRGGASGSGLTDNSQAITLSCLLAPLAFLFAAQPPPVAETVGTSFFNASIKRFHTRKWQVLPVRMVLDLLIDALSQLTCQAYRLSINLHVLYKEPSRQYPSTHVFRTRSRGTLSHPERRLRDLPRSPRRRSSVQGHHAPGEG
jgi:hypothetical protein